MATIKEDYVSFELAKLLKEKGFDEPCHSFYDYAQRLQFIESVIYDSELSEEDNECVAPTLQMAMKWLREVHNIDIDIETTVGMLGVKVYVPHISTYEPLEGVSSKVRQIKRGIHYKDDRGVIPALQYFDSYEEACEAAIKYCLDNLI